MVRVLIVVAFVLCLQSCVTLKPDGRGLVETNISEKLKASTILVSGKRAIIYTQSEDEGVDLNSVDITENGDLSWSRKTRDHVWYVLVVDIDEHLSMLRTASRWGKLAVVEANKVRLKEGNAFSYNIDKNIGVVRSSFFETNYQFLVVSGRPVLYVKCGRGLISLNVSEVDGAISELELFRLDKLQYHQDPGALKDSSIYK